MTHMDAECRGQSKIVETCSQTPDIRGQSKISSEILTVTPESAGNFTLIPSFKKSCMIAIMSGISKFQYQPEQSENIMS